MREQVVAYLARWARILRLSEFRITAFIVPGLPDLGVTQVDPVYKRATVKMRDPSDGSHPDWKLTAVHELLHVRIPIAAPELSPLRDVIETSVEMLARALVTMDGAGTNSDAIYRKAHTWARTIETAREGKGLKRMDGKRILEISVELAGMELSPEAMALVTELGGLAIGDEGAGKGVGEDLLKEAATIEPKDQMQAADPADAMYRAALGPAAWKAFQENARAMARSQVITMAREKFGDKLSQADQARLGKMSPREATIWLEGRESAPQVATGAHVLRREGLREPESKATASVPLVLPGEDPAKIPPHVAAVRAALGNLPGGPAAVAYALGGGK